MISTYRFFHVQFQYYIVISNLLTCIQIHAASSEPDWCRVNVVQQFNDVRMWTINVNALLVLRHDVSYDMFIGHPNGRKGGWNETVSLTKVWCKGSHLNSLVSLWLPIVSNPKLSCFFSSSVVVAKTDTSIFVTWDICNWSYWNTNKIKRKYITSKSSLYYVMSEVSF